MWMTLRQGQKSQAQKEKAQGQNLKKRTTEARCSYWGSLGLRSQAVWARIWLCPEGLCGLALLSQFVQLLDREERRVIRPPL